MVSKKGKKSVTDIPVSVATPMDETSVVQALPIVATPIVENSVKMFFTSNIGPIIVFTLILVVIGLVVNYVIYPLFVSNDAPTKPGKPIIPQTSNPKTNQPNTTQPNQPNQPNTTQPNQPNPTQKVIMNCGNKGVLLSNNTCSCMSVMFTSNISDSTNIINLFENNCSKVSSIIDKITQTNTTYTTSYRYFKDGASFRFYRDDQRNNPILKIVDGGKYYLYVILFCDLECEIQKDVWPSDGKTYNTYVDDDKLKIIDNNIRMFRVSGWDYNYTYIYPFTLTLYYNNKKLKYIKILEDIPHQHS